MPRYKIIGTFADGWHEWEEEVCKEIFYSELQKAMINYVAMPAQWCIAWFYVPYTDAQGVAFVIEEGTI